MHIEKIQTLLIINLLRPILFLNIFKGATGV
jgi:hypothetical protein